MHTLDLIKEVYKGEKKVVKFEVGTGSNPPKIDEDPAHSDMRKSVS